MEDYEAKKDIEALGEEEYETEEYYRQEKEPGGVSLLPIIQTAVCLLILLGALFLRQFAPEKFSQAESWYKQYIQEEIELPEILEENKKAQPGSTPLPTMAPAKEIFDSSEEQHSL